MRDIDMTPDLTAIDVALNDLTPHELNARANSPDAYESDDIANLAASIRTLGLLNPLIVQKTGKKWGVLAGGRRLAALRRLAEDKATKGWTLRTKIMCRVMAEDIAAATAWFTTSSTNTISGAWTDGAMRKTP